ncbi:MAG: hypothetical protein IRY85_21605 [Micromonosporaceae bacterium]|nr:hypothetical protein [Micromonosporaceae bacterium]
MRVVGCAAELATIDTFLTDGRRTLLIVGELGAGKTVLWEHGVARARQLGCRVLAARPVAGLGVRASLFRDEIEVTVVAEGADHTVAVVTLTNLDGSPVEDQVVEVTRLVLRG